MSCTLVQVRGRLCTCLSRQVPSAALAWVGLQVVLWCHALWAVARGWWGLVEVLVFFPSSSWPGHLQSVLDAVAVRQTFYGQFRGQVVGPVCVCVCWLL